jgi:thioredoxin reductase (NADPH)
MEKSKLAIIGSGPAGLTAAIYAARADLKPVVFTGLEFGGQLMTTTLVENFPGFVDGVMGPELMQNMLKQAEKLGAKMIYQNVKSVDFKDPKNLIVKTESGEEISFESVIVATGAKSRRLGLESENKYWGKGVSSCATCDGAFYRGLEIAVLGGGDSAVEEATFLTRFASKVYLINRKSELKASKAMQDRLQLDKKVEIVADTEVKEILGDGELVTGVKLYNNKTNKESTLELSGIFLAIGHLPNTGIFKDILELDKEGYITVNNNTHTSKEGVFVAGDVKDRSYQQAISAAGMGCMAALDVERYLDGNY